MLAIERQKKILELLHQKQVMRTSDLIRHFQVSHMTIRRDIQKLQDMNAVHVVSGGISLPDLPLQQKLLSEPARSDKMNLCAAEKEQIGKMAATLITPHSSIYIDAGTTTLALAHTLLHRDDLQIITNDFVIASYIIEYTTCRLIHTGGVVQRENHSCIGILAANTLRNFLVDIAFISAPSWDQRGISTPDEEKIAVKQAAADISSQCVLLSDSTKYGKLSPYLALPMNAFDVVITDSAFSAKQAHIFEEKGIHVIRVAPEKDTRKSQKSMNKKYPTSERV